MADMNEAQRQIMMHALQGGTFEFLSGRKGPYIKFVFPKNKLYPCPSDNCPGDGRYAAPGRGHLPQCTYPRKSMGHKKEYLVVTPDAEPFSWIVNEEYAAAWAALHPRTIVIDLAKI